MYLLLKSSLVLVGDSVHVTKSSFQLNFQNTNQHASQSDNTEQCSAKIPQIGLRRTIHFEEIELDAELSHQ